jgi:hypothetical protein
LDKAPNEPGWYGGQSAKRTHWEDGQSAKRSQSSSFVRRTNPLIKLGKAPNEAIGKLGILLGRLTRAIFG